MLNLLFLFFFNMKIRWSNKKKIPIVDIDKKILTDEDAVEILEVLEEMRIDK